MADGDLLPPSVYQGIGWSPGGRLSPPALAGAADFGGLPPSIVQGLGWAPPAGPPPDPGAPAPPPVIPAPPTSLPSASGAGQGPSAGPPPGTPAAPDYQVPGSAFGGGRPAAQPASPAGQPAAARPAAPPRPQTFDQRMNALDQREDAATAQGEQAIQAGVQAERGLHADQGAAYQRYDQQIQANAADRKAENEQWAKIYATNEAKLDADRKQIESWKFNRNRFMDDLGVGGQVSWGIGAILAGIGNAMQGIKGENPVIQMLQQNIHDANEQQMKERDNMVQKLGMDRQTGLDAQAYHATRQAEVDKQDGLALTALSKQLEEAAVKSADPMAQARGLKEAAALKAQANELFKSNVQLRSQHDMQAQQNAIAGGHLALDQKKFDWEKNKDQQQLDINAAKLLVQKQGKLDEEQAKRAIYIPDANGNLVVARKQDGTPVLAGSPEIASKDQNMVAAAAAYNRLIGQMVRGIKDHGGESDYLKSREWQNMQSDLESAVAELHDAYGITSFREPTMKFFEKMATGGVNPTSFVYDATAALEHSNQNLQNKVNERIAARGYDGPRFGWQDTGHPAAAPETADDRAIGRALTNPSVMYDKDPDRVISELGINPTPQMRTTELTQKIGQRIGEVGGILPSVRQSMDTWAAAMASPDPQIAARFRQTLEKIADQSESPAAAAYAEQLLARARQQQLDTAPGTANAPEVMRGASGAPVPRER